MEIIIIKLFFAANNWKCISVYVTELSESIAFMHSINTGYTNSWPAVGVITSTVVTVIFGYAAVEAVSFVVAVVTADGVGYLMKTV